MDRETRAMAKMVDEVSEIYNEEKLRDDYIHPTENSPFSVGQFDSGDKDADKGAILDSLAEYARHWASGRVTDTLGSFVDAFDGFGPGNSGEAGIDREMVEELAWLAFERVDWTDVAEYVWGDDVSRLLDERDSERGMGR